MVTPTPKKARTGDNNMNTNANNTSNSNISNINTTISNININNNNNNNNSTSHTKNDAAYSRKNKSLGVLARTFCTNYENSSLGTEIIIDALAVHLGVERRRIYDVVNIFESIRLVVKKGKNTYAWMGKAHLPAMLSLLQHEAVFDYPADAVEAGIVAVAPTADEIAASKANVRDPKKDKSLTRLSQQFLQLFLIGHGTVSLPDASDKIHGEPDLDDQQAAARSLKTKIRRLYDIANVFMAVGFLHKVDDKLTVAVPSQRRPCFSWAFYLSPQQIASVYNEQLSDKQKNGRTPFTPRDVMSLTTRTPTGPVGKTATMASASSKSSASSRSSASSLDHRHHLQHQPAPHLLSTPRMPPPGVKHQQQHQQHVWMTNSKMAAAPNANANGVLANIHQMGGAVLSAEKSKYEGPRRVSLPDPMSDIGNGVERRLV
jgi:hypothetical protein